MTKISDEKRVEKIYYAFYHLLLKLCEVEDQTVVSSTMLAIAQKLSRAVNTDHDYVKLIEYMAESALTVEPLQIASIKQAVALVSSEGIVVATGVDENRMLVNRGALEDKYGKLKIIRTNRKQYVGYPLIEDVTYH